MVGPPGEPSTRNSLPSFSTMVGVIADSGRLFAPIAFAGPWISPYILGTPCFDREVVHLIVHQEAQPFGRDARAEAVVQRRGHRDRIALGIDHRVVRRVLRLAHRSSAEDAPAHTDRACVKIAGRFSPSDGVARRSGIVSRQASA